MISSFAVLRLPALPPLPQPLRGAFTASLRIAYTGTSEDGERMIAPLRTLPFPLGALPWLQAVRDQLVTESFAR
jgi:hypothetical protein